MPCVAECGKRVLFEEQNDAERRDEDVFSSSGHKPVFVPLLNHAPIDIDQTAEYLASEAF